MNKGSLRKQIYYFYTLIWLDKYTHIHTHMRQYKDKVFFRDILKDKTFL